MNYPLTFDLGDGTLINQTGPIPREGDAVGLSGRPLKQVERVTFRYGDRDLMAVEVLLRKMPKP